MIVHAQSLSHVQLFVIPWSIVHQAPLSMEFSMPGYWGGLPFRTPGDLASPGIEPLFLASPAFGRHISYHCATWEAPISINIYI